MAETKAKTETVKKNTTEDFYNEKVPIYVHKPESIDDNSVTVTVNGRNYQIMYNTEVMVPRFVALVVEESERNKRIADEKSNRRLQTQKLGEF